MQVKTLKQGINKAYLKVLVNRTDLDTFKNEATAYLNDLSQADGESEEHLKNYLRDFLLNTFYRAEERLVNTSSYVDLSIYSGKTISSNLEVIIETKMPGNQAEMISRNKLNAKAFHQALHYYFVERENGNEDLKHVIITNYTEFFVFDAQEIERLFYAKPALKKTFRNWKTDQKISSNKGYMYDKFRDFIEETQPPLQPVYVNLKDYETLLKTPATGEEDKKLLPVFKLFSPEHLVKKPFANDSNSLDIGFYKELLHILGLEQVKENGKQLIQRLPENERHRGSLIENTIEILLYDQHINKVKDSGVQYGETKDEQLFGVALELVITWMNRILFLKLMEAQLLSYHENDQKFKFLDYKSIDEYDELEKLFFRVLALRNEERPVSIQERFGHIPYLNSSLFDATKLEDVTTRISGLDDKASLELYARSVLKKGANPPKGSLNTLQYLLSFLDAYNFNAESSGGIQSEDKTLINASVLGLIFEKINGYKDGSFFTPGFITEYMARETLRKSVTDKLNKTFGWECTEFEQLVRKVESVELKAVNDVVNSVTICDPAVGSGHFLVSCLNELIAIKAELKILCDQRGLRIPNLDIEVENDELAVEYEGELFEYKLNHTWSNGIVTRKPAGNDRQRIQETLFHEKKFLIENCLFGVDINPNSVKICRLRLWIELLKHAYYRADGDYSELEVLPNIDINIKKGNSLVSRFDLDEDLSAIFKKSEHSLEDYKQAVSHYRQTRDRNEKQRLQQLIDDIKSEYSVSLTNNKPINKKLSKARGQLELMQNQDLFGSGKAGKIDLKKQEQKVKKLEQQKADEEAGVFYNEAFEWRFEFPEVLDDEGNYKGFDVVIGNPPYVRQESLGTLKEFLKRKFEVYKGTADLYVYFYELSHLLLKRDGIFSMITANKFIRTNYGAPLRDYLSQKTHLLKLIDFGELPVFDEAATFPLIVITRNTKVDEHAFEFYQVKELLPDGFREHLEERKLLMDSRSIEGESWSLAIPEELDILDKMQDVGIKLEKYIGDVLKYGIKTGYNEAFIIDEETKSQLINEDPKSSEIIHPFISGDDVRFYKIKESDKYLITTKIGVDLEKYPAVKNHLFKYESKLKKRTDQGNHWWELRPCSYYHLIESDKIIFPEIAKESRFTFDDEGLYINKTIFMIPSSDKYLLGVLNSKLVWLFLKRTCSSLGDPDNGGRLNLQRIYVSKIPIANAEKAEQKQIGSIVDKILTAKKQNPAADTTKLESEIDRLVYELYGLSEEEIGIVEGKLRLKYNAASHF